MPAASKYMDSLTNSILLKKEVSESITTAAEEKMLSKMADKYSELSTMTDRLETDIEAAKAMDDELAQAKFYHDTVFKDMTDIRELTDYMEAYIPEEDLPYPTYSKILFYV